MNKRTQWMFGLLALLAGCVIGYLVGSRYPEKEDLGTEKVSVSVAQQGQQTLSTNGDFYLTPASFSFGSMIEGEARETVVKLNRPEGHLRIGRVYTSCSCLQASVPKMIFTGDENVPITLRLHSLSLAEAKRIQFYLELLEPVERILKGEVSLSPTRQPAKLMVKPDAFHFGSVRGKKVASVELTNLTRQAVLIRDIRPEKETDGFVIKKKPVSIPPGKTVTVTAELNRNQTGRAPFRATVLIQTNLIEHAQLRIPADGTLLEQISGK